METSRPVEMVAAWQQKLYVLFVLECTVAILHLLSVVEKILTGLKNRDKRASIRILGDCPLHTRSIVEDLAMGLRIRHLVQKTLDAGIASRKPFSL
mmetsp:Transcript_1112/g.2162  ORF Transcript_1112/g.2162 Transcript_1112/m.2162 type:complete len:96 (-) Transcript_1112:529-816(-)